jgi:AraC-like DNA-binding protein
LTCHAIPLIGHATVGFRPMLQETVATTSSRALLAACEEIGLSRAGLLASAGLTAEQVNDPDGRLPVAAVATLWRSALEQSGDPGLGLRVAVAVPFGAYRVIDFLAASAPTVGEGLVRVARFFPLVNSSLAWEITDEGSRMRLTLRHAGMAGELPRPYAEFAVTVTVLQCRRASGFAWPVADVTFAFDAPGPPDRRYRDALGCDAEFGSTRNSFSVSKATWESPSRAPSTQLLQTLEGHATHLMASLQTDHVVSREVARHIVLELDGGTPSLAHVARRMAQSVRTLQRRLDQEGTSFAEILDRTRQHFARTYMNERGLALTEIAFLLGFSEQSAFTRAFQRWFGIAPSEYRSRGGTGNSAHAGQHV